MKFEMKLRGTRARAFRFDRVVTSAMVGACMFATTGYAQSLESRREEGRRQVAPVFANKYISIEGNLVKTWGPDSWGGSPTFKIIGCPAVTYTPGAVKSVDFNTEGVGRVVGDLDGFNMKLVRPSGYVGMGVVIPTNTTGPAIEPQSSPQLSFDFDATRDVTRTAIDEAATELDRCLNALPPGTYMSQELRELCPVPTIPVEDLRQTCVVSTGGYVTEPLADGSGYKAILNESLLCDGIGFGQPQPGNPGWVSCYTATYEGKAVITSGAPDTLTARLGAASRAALKKCQSKFGSSKRKQSRQKRACAFNRITQGMAGGITR